MVKWGNRVGYSQPFSSWELTAAGSCTRNWPTAAISPSLAAIQMFGEGILVPVSVIYEGVSGLGAGERNGMGAR